MGTKLLLADDSITIQKVVGIIFSNEDYELTIVDNGNLAIEKAMEIKPDIMLIDAVMPGRNGYEVCQEVRSDASLKNIPLLLMTGAFEPFDENRAHQCGADDFISKPFESQHLVGKVTALLETYRNRNEEISPPVDTPKDVQPADQFFATPLEDPWNEPVNDSAVQAVSIAQAFDGIPDVAIPLEPETVAFEEPVLPKADVVKAEPGDDPWGVFDLIDLEEQSKPLPAGIEVVEFAPQASAPVREEPFFAEPPNLVAETIVIEEISEFEPDFQSALAGSFEAKWEPVEEEAFSYQDEELPPPGETFTVGMGEPLASLTDHPEQFAEESFAELEVSSSLEYPDDAKYPDAPPAPSIPVVATAPTEDQLREILSGLSRDVIERIVWEVVPDLAESIIREEIRKIKHGLIQ